MKNWIVLILAMLMSTGILKGACGNVIYVKHDATGFLNDGSSWGSAYLDLQSALDEAAACSDIQEIWVAGGIYKPSVDPTAVSNSGRDFIFAIFQDIKILGGFCGWESQASQRVKYLCPTILSGDHNEDDVLTDKNHTDYPFINDGDNSYNIMWAMGLTNATIIDGFTFSGGNANHPSILFKQIGGAIFNDARGLGSSPQIINCIFQHNKAQEGGGAIYNYGVGGNASPLISSCQFRHNRSDDHGGAFYNHASGASSSSYPVFSNCLFEHNLSVDLGGGLYSIHELSALAAPIFSQSTFVYNEARLGGALFINRTSGLITSNPSVKGCIFFFNEAKDDQSTASYGINNVTVTPQYSLYPEATVDQINFNTNANPQFVNDFFNYRLKPSSPAIDEGEFDSGFLPSTSDRDLDDNARRLGSLKDMGSYEFLSCPIGNTIYVDALSTSGTGASPTSALSSINMALNMACNCNGTPVIDIAEGRYVPHRLADLGVDEDRTNHSFVMTCPVVLQGHEGVLITGDILNNDSFELQTNPTREDNCNHLIGAYDIDKLTLDSIEFTSANLDAVVMSNGTSDKIINVTNCKFIENASEAISIISLGTNTNSIRVENCAFERNFHETDSDDGCISIQTSDFVDVKILNCQFRDNEMGGIYIKVDDGSTSLIESCSFTGNSSIMGAGIEIDEFANGLAYHTIKNCEFVDNTAFTGAALFGNRKSQSNYIVDNCTFFRNHCSAISLAAIDFFGLRGSAIITNSIFWENTNLSGTRSLSGDMDVSYSMIETSSCPTSSNTNVRCGEVMFFEVDPQFRSIGGTFGADLYLNSTSPAINRGSKRTKPNSANDVDITGYPRINSNRIDLGAHEYRPIFVNDCPVTVSNPVDLPETVLDISVIASQTISLSQDYITPVTGALFLDAPEIKIYPSLEIGLGAVMEVHIEGCDN